MPIDFVHIDNQSIAVLKETAVYEDVVSSASQDGFDAMLGQFGESLHDEVFRKISLHKDNLDGILGMSDKATMIFSLTHPPSICRVLCSAIGLAGAESSAEVFEELLRMMGHCSMSCTKLCGHYDRDLRSYSIPAEESERRFARAYEAVLHFLATVIQKLDFKKIHDLKSPLWKEILEAYEKSRQGIENECEALDQAHQKLAPGISSSAISMHSLSTTLPTPSFHETTPSSYYMLPKKPHKIYYREEEIQSLEERLEQYRSICIVGIGGVGKTSLALLYAYQFQLKYQFIFFLRSDSKLSLNQDFTQVAQKLNLPGVNVKQHLANRELVLDWLQSTAFRWLLIFDEADNGDLTDDYWPVSANGDIIVTARAGSVGFGFCEWEIRLDPFPPEVGAKLVRELSLWGGNQQEADLESAKLLNDELQGLPLGIKQMIALMRTQKTPLAKFVRLYREDKHRYHSRPPGHGGVGSKKRLHTNWLVSFKSLRELPDCKVLFGILTLLEHTGIPEELFNHWNSPIPRSTGHLLSFCKRENDFVEVEAALLDRALIDKDPNNGDLSIHKVVRVEFESFLSKDDRQLSFDLASKLLHNVFPRKYTGSRLDDRSRSQYARYIQHLLTLNAHYIEPPQSLPPLDATPEFMTLTSYCAWYLFETTDFPNLQRLLEGGIKACEQVNDRDRDNTVYAFLHHVSGTAETAQGNFRAAEKSLLRALRIRENLENPNTDDITMTLNNLGIVYDSLQRYDEAAQFASRAQNLLIESKGAGTVDHDQIQSIKMAEHNLQRISIHSKMMKVERKDLEDMIDFFKKRGNWFMTGHSYLILGLFLQVSGDISASGHAFGEARNWLDKPGRAEKSPQIAMMIYKQGYVAYINKEFSKAERLFQESLKISRLYVAIPGEQARTLAMLARSQQMIPGKEIESKKYMSEARDLLRKLQERSQDFEDVCVEDEVAMNRIVTGLYQ